MAFPTILFNNGTGSDTAASGAGPATAVTGTAAAHTGGVASTTITLTNSPDLSGVSTTGNHCLWLKTASGRQFSKITAADNTAKTVTVEDSFNIASGSAVNYAIGGKRQTIGNTDSRNLFASDAKPGWTIQCEDDPPALTSTLACTAAGDSTTGQIVFQGDSATTQRLLTSSTNNVAMLSGGLGGWTIRNFKFTSTAATKTTSYGIVLNASSSATWLRIENCIFGDATNKLQCGVLRNGSAQLIGVFEGCDFVNCLGDGVQSPCGGSGSLKMQNCFVDSNGGAGVHIPFSGIFSVQVHDCVITNNTGQGVVFDNSGSDFARPSIERCVIHGNGSDGVRISVSSAMLGAVIRSNQITKNGGYGINYTGSNGDTLKGQIDYNNFGNASDSTQNTSGAVNGFTQGANSLTVSPQYVSAGTGNYAGGSNVAAKGWPASTHVVGAVKSATTNYVDIGIQQQASAGSTGGIFFG